MERAFGNIFIRDSAGLLIEGRPFGRKGDVVEGHAHNFDHVTQCWGAPIRIEAQLNTGATVETEVEPGDERLILAGVKHRLVAVGDGARYKCIYAHRLPQTLVELRGRVSPDYDELLDTLIAMANQAHADVVQRYTGWGPAYL